MAETFMQLYESMNEEERQEMYRFAQFVISKRCEEKTISQSHIDRFFGTIDGDTAKVMLTAVDECRRIEPDEW